MINKESILIKELCTKYPFSYSEIESLIQQCANSLEKAIAVLEQSLKTNSSLNDAFNAINHLEPGGLLDEYKNDI